MLLELSLSLRNDEGSCYLCFVSLLADVYLVESWIGGRPTPVDDRGNASHRRKLVVRPGDKPVYFYRDGSKLVDLFSYHSLDSNRDGIANLEIRHDEKFLMIKSQGYPNHPTAIFPNSNNPNRIEVQEFTFRLPLVPQKADRITRLPMGPIGTAINGVVLFNPFEMEG